MPKKAHTEEQIVAVLQQGQAGEKVADICRNVGISEGTYYAWKKQFAGLGITELRELRQLREENSRLKRLVAVVSGLAHSQCSPASMNSSRLFLGRLLSSRACLCFADRERFSKTKPRRTMIFQRTATPP